MKWAFYLKDGYLMVNRPTMVLIIQLSVIKSDYVKNISKFKRWIIDEIKEKTIYLWKITKAVKTLQIVNRYVQVQSVICLCA